MGKWKDVNEYLSAVPAEFRGALEKLRKTIRSAAPGAVEGFSYGVPAFLLDEKPVVCIAAFKNHCGFYPLSPDIIAKFSSELKSFETAKGTIRFRPEKPLPATLVRRIVKARIAELGDR